MSPAAAPIHLGAVRGGLPGAAFAFAYSAFTTAPPADWPGRYQRETAAARAQLLTHTLDGNLQVLIDGQTGMAEEYFPLFRLALLLTHWLAAPATPGREMRLILDDYEHCAALTLDQQLDFVVLRWPVPTRWWPAATTLSQHVTTILTVPTQDFTAASQEFIRQLQADVSAHLGFDIGDLLTG